MQDYLAKLDSNQFQAATTIHGPLLIQAGAGSGKTTTVISRILYMLNRGIAPQHILAITFTNKAAKELKNRLEASGNHQARLITASTIHSFCTQILRFQPYHDIYLPQLIHNANYEIVDDNEGKRRILNNIRDDYLETHDLDSVTADLIKQFPLKKIKAYISQYKDFFVEKALNISTPMFDIADEDQVLDFYIQTVIAKYVKYTAKYNLIDFDDMLLNALWILKKNPNILKIFQNRYTYIMVDEYQDTSTIQEAIIRMLADTKEKNICVVGDPNQSIYAFRGANINNILNFAKQYPAAKVVTLARNYRSSKQIVSLGADAIHYNPNPYKADVHLTATRDFDFKPEIVRTDSQYDEGYFIAQQISRIINAKDVKQYQDIAVLYRNHASAFSIQTVFTRMQIPYVVIHSQDLYEHPAVQDLLSYLSLIQDHNDDHSFIQIVNVPSRRIGTSIIDMIKQYQAKNNTLSMYAILKNIIQTNSNIRSDTLSGINSFINLIDPINTHQAINLVDVLRFILNQGKYLQYANQRSYKHKIKWTDYIDQLLLLANKFDLDHPNLPLNKRISQFKDEIAMNELKDSDNKKDGVQLLTIHSAKGLEYDTVFIIDLINWTFPSAQALNALRYKPIDKKPLEEERRLFYVAITRAKNRLFLLFPSATTKNNKLQPTEPALFLNELNPNHYDYFEFKAESRY